MKWKIGMVIILALAIIAGVAYAILMRRAVDEVTVAPETILPPLPNSPLDASYSIDGNEIPLTAGRYEKELEPGSASKEVVTVWGEPVVADVNSDGVDDAALFLTYEGGGSGTFFYLAVAVRDGNGYMGSNAVPLGDRIAPQSIELWHEVLVANYADHAVDQAMSESPSEGVSRYFTVIGADITELGPFMGGEEVLAGELAWGEDYRTFKPCGTDSEYQVTPSSPATAVLTAVHAQRTGSEASQPVFMVLSGTVVESGEGSASAESLEVSTLLSAPEGDRCDVRDVQDTVPARTDTTSSTSVATTTTDAVDE